MIKVLPSTNPCPESDLLCYAKSLENLNIEYLHCDVMDGKFVENSCLGFETLENIRNNCNLLLDVHLMVDDSYKYAKKFATLKPNIITIHYETPKSTNGLLKIFKFLKSKDILVGLSVKPNTPVKMIERFVEYVDLILIMSVEPGKSGQKFIEESLEKIMETKQMIGNRRVIVEVDGGINETNYQSIINAGAEFLVMGSAFYNAKDKSALLTKIGKHYKIN